MTARDVPPRWRTALRPAAAGAMLLGACAAIDPAATVPTAGSVTVEALTDKQTVIDARGADVAIAPPPGLCITPDDVHLTDAAAVVVLGGCGGEATRLTRMVSVAATPLAPAGGAQAALDVMAQQLREPDGWRAMGFGDQAEDLRVVDVEMRDGALFVALERVGGQGGAFGSRCRALTEINGRLTVVTVAAPPERPVSANVLMDQAALMLGAIRDANATPTRPPQSMPQNMPHNMPHNMPSSRPPVRDAPAPSTPQRRPLA